MTLLVWLLLAVPLIGIAACWLLAQLERRAEQRDRETWQRQPGATE